MQELTKSQVLENLKKGNYEIEAKIEPGEGYFVLLTINNQEIIGYDEESEYKYVNCIDDKRCNNIFEMFGYEGEDDLGYDYDEYDYDDEDKKNIKILEEIARLVKTYYDEDYEKAEDKVKANYIIDFMEKNSYLCLETHTGFANLPGTNYFVKKENLESLKNQIEDGISGNIRNYGTSDFVIKNYSIYETTEELLNSIFYREPDTHFPTFYIYDGPNDIKSLDVDLYGTYVIEIPLSEQEVKMNKFYIIKEIMKNENFICLRTITGYKEAYKYFFVKQENLEKLKNEIREKIEHNNYKMNIKYSNDPNLEYYTQKELEHDLSKETDYELFETPDELEYQLLIKEPEYELPNILVYDGPNYIKELEVDLTQHPKYRNKITKIT